jgi:hypothetical protein
MGLHFVRTGSVRIVFIEYKHVGGWRQLVQDR